MIQIKDTPEKVSVAKKTISLKNIIVNDSKFVDESGDITNDIIAALPEGIEEVDFKIVIELNPPDEYMDIE